MVGASEWLAEQHAADERRFTHGLVGSFVVHVLVLAVLAFSPSPSPMPLTDVLNVDLVAAVPAAPAAKAPPRAAPKPAPPAPAAVAPPKPTPKEVVLPKEAPRAVPKKPVARPARRPEPVQYDDALSQLRQELGESTPAAPPTEDVSDEALEATTAPAASSRGTVDKELAAWVLATKRHVRRRYITPPEFLNRSLATGIEVRLTSNGALVGPPRVVRPSGDPFFDDNAVRAVLASAPLPAPPSAGTWTFVFTSEEK
jgi:outer membrane biosynthesis protein TonB